MREALLSRAQQFANCPVTCKNLRTLPQYATHAKSERTLIVDQAELLQSLRVPKSVDGACTWLQHNAFSWERAPQGTALKDRYLSVTCGGTVHRINLDALALHCSSIVHVFGRKLHVERALVA